MESADRRGILSNVAALLSIVVVTISSATTVVIFVQNQAAAIIILIFVVIVLFIAVPHFALMSGVIPSTTWLGAYTALLKRIPFLKAIVSTSGYAIPTGVLTQHFDRIVDGRMRADGWKRLHEELQTISLKVYIVKGLINPNNLEMTLHDLEIHWMQECSDLLKQFSGLERLPEGAVRDEFSNANQNARWLVRLLEALDKVDNLIGECDASGSLSKNIPALTMHVSEIERVLSELLKYLDRKLQRTIHELDSHIEGARSAFGVLDGDG